MVTQSCTIQRGGRGEGAGRCVPKRYPVPVKFRSAKKAKSCKTSWVKKRFTEQAKILSTSRENEGTERDIEGVGWDMSIPLKLFLVLGGNGSLFPQTSA